MEIDVIIPSMSLHEHIQMTKNCVQSLRNSEDNHLFNIIIIESLDKIIEMGQDKTLFATKPFNYNKAMDIGIKASSNEWIAMVNNDVIFQKNWFSEILKAKEKFPELKSFSSWNDVDNWHEKRIPNCEEVRVGYGIGFELCGWILIGERKYIENLNIVNEVTFWCSDNVYSDELQRLSYKHALVKNSKINHLVSKTLTNGKVDLKNLTEQQAINYANWRSNINI